jgi:hypothetical protein
MFLPDMMSLFSKGSTDENSFTWNLKKGIFRDFFVQNFVLFLFCISGAGAPCGLLQIPAFRFHRFAWPFETAGPSVDIAGKRRVGKDKSNTPPRPHQKWDEPRSAGAKRFSLLDFKDFAIRFACSLRKVQNLPSVCVGAGAPSRSRIMRSRNSITAAVKKPRPSHRAGLDAFTGPHAKAHGGWEDRLMRKIKI